MGDIRFDETLAPTYDTDTADLFDPAVLGPTVDLLAGLAGDGPALELAIGTGRVGLALASRGIEVHGIELSPPMVEQLRAKPGGPAIPVTIGDMATTSVAGGPFRLVYLVYNTITNLTTQDEQVACFANAATHLAPGGCFVVECYVPVLPTPGRPGVLFHAGADHVGYDTFDGVDQRSWSHHWWDRDGVGATRFSAPYRYVWPSELDLMARLAGLTRIARYGGWDGSPFTSDSPSRIAVYQR